MAGRGRRVVLASLAAVTVAGAAALTLGPAPEPAAAAGLTTFADCQAVDDWFTPQMTTWMTFDMLASGAADSRSSTAMPVAGGSTGTNVQEAGIDEPDTLKAVDGLAVTVHDSTLHLVDVSSDTPRATGSLRLPVNVLDAQVFLVGKRAVVIATPLPTQDSGAWDPGLQTTWTGVVDLADASAPTLITTSEVEGFLVDARLSGDTVRMVTSFRPNVPFTAEPTTDQALAELTGEDFLPQLISRDANGAPTKAGLATSCTALTHPSEAAGPQVTTVSSLVASQAVSGLDPVTDRTSVAADGSIVYATAATLYLATHAGGMFVSPRDAVSTTPDRTEIHAFDTTRSGATAYQASGGVDGTVIGRWAFSERDGVLRVATTRTLPSDPPSDQRSDDQTVRPTSPDDSPVPVSPGPVSPGPGSPGQVADPGPPPDVASPAQQPRTDSAVTTLRRDGDRLVTVGTVTGLGKGEQIQSVRWFDDTAYVVTFRQTDPLYVLDLSDPAKPRVTGELKVPGFSSYLHPVGGDRLLGVGSSATEEGRVTGLQISLFDVSDPTAPRLLDSYTRAGTYSPVAHDSRAFSFVPDRQVAIIPATDAQDTPEQLNAPGSRELLLSVRIGTDGSLSVSETRVAATEPGTALGRVIPVGPDRLAGVLTQYQSDGWPQARLAVFDLNAVEKGSTALG